jgi:hypothetical protein
LDCTCSERIVSVPLLVAILGHSDQASNGSEIFCVVCDLWYIPVVKRLVVDFWSLCYRPRYSTSIFLRHSALLI